MEKNDLNKNVQWLSIYIYVYVREGCNVNGGVIVTI